MNCGYQLTWPGPTPGLLEATEIIGLFRRPGAIDVAEWSTAQVRSTSKTKARRNATKRLLGAVRAYFVWFFQVTHCYLR